MQPSKNSLSVFAPAKLNLFLHITGRQNNGYHLLDSLVCFVDIGDKITIEPQQNFSFEISGPFSNQFQEKDRISNIDSENLVVKAARRLAQICEKPLNVKITLEKNLPLAAGIGGGSSDAASTIWGLQELWDLKRDESYLLPLMTNLGADVPACLNCAPVLMRGIGVLLTPAPEMPEVPILLVNPMIDCPTREVFMHYHGHFKNDITLPKRFTDIYDLSAFLQKTENDLYASAAHNIPEIENVIHSIKIEDGCLLSRMSGSGATCFGLFESEVAAEKAKMHILDENPDWWVQTGWLNRPERY